MGTETGTVNHVLEMSTPQRGQRPEKGQLNDHSTHATAVMEHKKQLLFTVALLAAIPVSLENFEVISPRNVLGVVGLDTVLPCNVSSTKPLYDIEVQWKKITDGHIEDVYIWRNTVNQPGQKYVGRTELPKDGLASGNVSLTLKNVMPADEGTYSCIVNSKDWSADTTTMLSIAGTSEVFFEILGPRGQGIELACRSHGWFPKPTVEWVVQNKQMLSPDTQIHQDSKKLFSVLSRVTVTRQEVEEVTCKIQSNLAQAEKTTVRLSKYEKMTSNAEYDILQARCEFRRARSYMVPITLDVAWKHPELALSPDQRTVHHEPSDQGSIIKCQLPIVVGREGFASGRHYWEVQVWNGLDWEVGVLTETVRDTLVGESREELPEDGVWSLRRVKGKFWPEEANNVMHQNTAPLAAVGLDLDLEHSTLSFYNAGVSGLILEVSIETSTKLYPFLKPGLSKVGEKGKPLSINHNTGWDYPQKMQYDMVHGNMT
ncbi:butyrophilin subfamily 1 member A1-like [Oxyura jamaicensis]|uniref:butyrophilin subfamily 1 member A1-like n=1 Tax=Oxyura jamaicensis TaxID=8884 RepID=UPI0015A5AB39|nr:butyrophilin subfamily 1 member A1-like [Oxyura jamaicensis]